jgi:hypothetical protein
MSMWNEFWQDEGGALLSAELVAVGTVAVVGTTVGLSTLSKSVNSELTELAVAVRSLNQSYSVPGHASCRAWTAGSSYTQRDVKESVHDLLGDCVDRDCVQQDGVTKDKENKVKEEAKSEQPKQKQRKKQKPDNEKRKNKSDDDSNRDASNSDESAVEESDLTLAPQVETTKPAVEDDDESQVETIIVPATDA